MDIRSIGKGVPLESAPLDRNGGATTLPAVAKTAAPVQTAAAVPQAGAIPDMTQVAQAVKNMNKTMENLSPNLEFSVDSDIHRTIVKVVDQQTKEVIRQIPSEEIIELAKAMDQAQGLLIKQKA